MLESDIKQHPKDTRTRQATLYSATMGKYELDLVESACEDVIHPRFSNVDGQTVPGRGKVTGHKCGLQLGFFQCPQDGYVDGWYYNCGRAGCPVCFRHWLARRTKDSGRRLNQIANLLHIAPSHIIISPPPNWKGSKQEIIKMAKKAGIVGGLIIYHPWRFRRLDNDEPISWKRCNINPLSEEKIPSYGVYSPHWHILGWGVLVKSNIFYHQTKWFYKNRGRRPNKQAYATLYYQLSHSVIDGRRQSLTWFGITANNKLTVDVEERYIAKLCPWCQTPMRKYQHYYSTEIEVDNKRKVRFKNYKFKNGIPRLRS